MTKDYKGRRAGYEIKQGYCRGYDAAPLVIVSAVVGSDETLEFALNVDEIEEFDSLIRKSIKRAISNVVSNNLV